MQSLYDQPRFSDPWIRLMSQAAKLAGSNVSESIFPNNMQVENSRPVHIICYVGSSATHSLTISPSRHRHELEWFQAWQLFRV